MRLSKVVARAFVALVVPAACHCGGAGSPCRSAADCGSAQVCLSTQTCAPRCSSSSQCSLGERCSGGGGCVAEGGCGDDKDCALVESCWHDGVCHPRCSSTVACPPGQVCTFGRCLFPPPAADGGGRDGGCGGELFQAARVEANFLIVLDRSGSMSAPVGGRSKWSIAVDAVRQVTAQYESQIRFGLELFPGASSCQPGSVVVPIGDRTASAIAAKFPSSATGSGTPIGASLAVAARVPELSDASRSNNVLLITDGKENCGGRPVDEVRAMRAAGIRTTVVGFGGEVDASMLSQMAQEGGTGRAGMPIYYQADDAAALSAALGQAALGVLGCDFKLGKVPPDPSRIYVYVNGRLAPRDPARTNGWEYTTASNRVGLYGALCDQVRVDPAAKISVVYGCPDDSVVEGTGGRDAGSAGLPDGFVLN